MSANSSTAARKSGVSGFQRRSCVSTKARYSAGSSEGRSGDLAVRPCLMAFCDEMALPSGVRGPVAMMAAEVLMT